MLGYAVRICYGALEAISVIIVYLHKEVQP